MAWFKVMFVAGLLAATIGTASAFDVQSMYRQQLEQELFGNHPVVGPAYQVYRQQRLEQQRENDRAAVLGQQAEILQQQQQILNRLNQLNNR